MPVNEKKVKDIIQMLDGMAYLEWKHVKMTIDNYFRVKERELNRTIKLSSEDSFKYSILQLSE